ncbi:TPA: hypothetical protein ACM4DG_004265 [Escherichia coli]
MTRPEAFTTVGIAMAVALVVYSICRWGQKRFAGKGELSRIAAGA